MNDRYRTQEELDAERFEREQAEARKRFDERNQQHAAQREKARKRAADMVTVDSTQREADTVGAAWRERISKMSAVDAIIERKKIMNSHEYLHGTGPEHQLAVDMALRCAERALGDKNRVVFESGSVGTGTGSTAITVSGLHE